MNTTDIDISPPLVPSCLRKRGGFIVENPGYNKLKSVAWKVRPNQLICSHAFWHYSIQFLALILMGPGLSWAWLAEWPALEGLFDPFWARIVLSCIIILGWVGLVFAIFGRKRIAFDTKSKKIFFRSRLKPSVNYALDFDRVVSCRVSPRSRLYTHDSTRTSYKTYEFKLILKEVNITLFETCSEKQAIVFGEIVSQMIGKPFEQPN